jgi:hypothetical protein
MDAPRERILVFALMVKLDYLIVFDDRHACFMAIRRDH